MINEKLDRIEKDLSIIKELTNSDYFKYLERQCEMVAKVNDEYRQKNQQLHSIIKEVREYIEKYDFITGYYESNYDDGNDTYTHYTVKEELLEILDKENNNG